MKRAAIALLPAALLTFALVASASSAASPQIYGQELVDRIAAKNPDVISLALHVTAPGSSENKVIASNDGTSGADSDETVLDVLKTGVEKTAMDKSAGRFTADLVLKDASQRPIGVLTVSLASKSGQGAATLLKHARNIRNYLARHTSYLTNLLEPALLDPNLSYQSYGQELIEQELVKHQNVLILAMHAATPKNSDPEIVASSIGRIGKKADSDDLRMIKTGVSNLEVNETGDRFEDELALQDVSGDEIGALGVVFAYKDGDDKAKLVKQATEIRDELKRRITTAGNLIEPYPYDPEYSANTYAQHLVDDELARRPDVLILALHITPPGKTQNIIAASNIGRIGKKADDDDMGVIKTGVPVLEVNATGKRFEVESRLKDSSGKIIGAVSVVYSYRAGDDKAALHKKADDVGRDLSRRIPSLAKLFEAR